MHDISFTNDDDGDKKRNRVDAASSDRDRGKNGKVQSPSRSNSSGIDDTKGHYLGGRGDVIKDRCREYPN